MAVAAETQRLPQMPQRAFRHQGTRDREGDGQKAMPTGGMQRRSGNYDGRMRLADGKILKLRSSSDDGAADRALTFSCFCRRSFLNRERTCCWLAEALERESRDHPFGLWAYVFMPEHLHPILWPTVSSFRIRTLRRATVSWAGGMSIPAPMM